MTTGLAGSGAVAIWHGIAPESREEFSAWHGTEHGPERIGIVGFLPGGRYVAVRADLEYFNLYEVLSPQVLTGSDYQQRFNNPTPWTTSTVRHFRRVARSLGRIAATFGAGQGGLVATWRHDVAEGESAAHIEMLSRTVPAQLAGQKIIAGSPAGCRQRHQRCRHVRAGDPRRAKPHSLLDRHRRKLGRRNAFFRSLPDAVSRPGAGRCRGSGRIRSLSPASRLLGSAPLKRPVSRLASNNGLRRAPCRRYPDSGW